MLCFAPLQMPVTLYAYSLAGQPHRIVVRES